MPWPVILSDEYEEWLLSRSHAAQKAIAVDLNVLSIMGPQLGRPHVDHVKGSRFPNMKELRTSSSGHAYRSLFAFDPERKALILAGGEKTGKAGKRLYSRLIMRADAIYERYLHDQAKHRKDRRE
jgi:hypothetical protein